MAVETIPAFEQDETYSAETLRHVFGTLLQRGASIGSITGGLVSATDMQVTAGTGMQVVVAVGEAWIPGSSVSTQGGYLGRVTSSTALAISASNESNPRIDTIIAQVKDKAVAGGEDSFTVSVVTGTAESGATLANKKGAGSVPASSLVLAYVLIPAKAVKVESANIENVAGLLEGALPPGDGTVDTDALAASAVTAAEIASEAVTDAKVVKGRALVETENAYSAQVERTEGEYEASATRLAHVILTVYLKESSAARLTVTVGGTTVAILGDDTTLPASLPSFPISFYVPPGVKWGIQLENISKVKESHILF